MGTWPCRPGNAGAQKHISVCQKGHCTKHCGQQGHAAQLGQFLSRRLGRMNSTHPDCLPSPGCKAQTAAQQSVAAYCTGASQPDRQDQAQGGQQAGGGARKRVLHEWRGKARGLGRREATWKRRRERGWGEAHRRGRRSGGRRQERRRAWKLMKGTQLPGSRKRNKNRWRKEPETRPAKGAGPAAR